MSLKRKAANTLSSATDKATKTTHNTSITSFFGAPKPPSSLTLAATSSIASGNGPKFDKEKWVSGLSPEVKGLLKLEIETLDESYLSVKEIRDEICGREFLDLKRFLKKEIEGEKKKVFPPLEEVYSWSRHTPLHTVKAVILGQDPYHNHNQAHGLCFSVRPPTQPPPSLVNIYKALKNDYPSFNPPPKPNSGLLTPWAERGVLMLNTCLTVRAHEANSHKDRGWERFTQKIIDVVAKTRTRGVVFLAWGTPAGKRVSKVDRSRHKVLQSVHPSPLAAHKGFFDCGHFKEANKWLEQRYSVDGIIDWNLSGKGPIAPISKVAPTNGTPTQDVVKKPTPTPVVNQATVPKKPESEFDDDDLDDADAMDALNDVEMSTAQGTQESSVTAIATATETEIDPETNDHTQTTTTTDNNGEAKDTKEQETGAETKSAASSPLARESEIVDSVAPTTISPPNQEESKENEDKD